MAKRQISAAIIASIAFVSVPMAPLHAESLDELDAISDRSVNEEAALDDARALAETGALLEAIATLERMLAENPKSREGRLLHALYLCKVDDRRGGLVEIDKLKSKEFGKKLLKEARGLCEAQPQAEG
ncbi:hypothetical protein [Erythrobacter mangrovi]|uniref:Tetratricopeptide repeat protein n=1 Tax=Erythrobacter mangrovi TaxID=2739433 RepID=A0A7D4B8E1_9SPHN|nr:hypothetical protein [Erythrobacter mangrovi]QKG71763.1 hypothetical protein HQR01_10550 [Erythrobacter mangrovi]